MFLLSVLVNLFFTAVAFVAAYAVITFILGLIVLAFSKSVVIGILIVCGLIMLGFALFKFFYKLFTGKKYTSTV